MTMKNLSDSCETARSGEASATAAHENNICLPIIPSRASRVARSKLGGAEKVPLPPARRV
jgi:hypothetical protein